MVGIQAHKAASLILVVAHSLPVHSLDLDSRDDILKSSKNLAAQLIQFYDGNATGQTPGLLPEVTAGSNGSSDGYYWWQSGVFMSTYIDYWHLTGDETYNDIVMQGVMHQIGDKGDFMPANHTNDMGNDDQAVWAMGALTAAEYGFPDTPADDPEWIDLAVAVFDEQAERWDMEEEEDTCNGGLRWQIPMFNRGYDFKSSTSSIFFQALAARLARFTGNETYAEYADKAWEWMYDTEFINHETWQVNGGAQVEANCTDLIRWVASAGSTGLTMGAAFMYNYTDGSSTWKTRVEKLLDPVLDAFFKKDGSFIEAACPNDRQHCPRDFVTYKALSFRWLAVTSQVAPFAADSILTALQKAADKEEGKYDGDFAMEDTMEAKASACYYMSQTNTRPTVLMSSIQQHYNFSPESPPSSKKLTAQGS
ncbi:hypothetical protein ACJZ2D_004930 [Fusarium nematophilum]